jgi:hypothetical protein
VVDSAGAPRAAAEPADLRPVVYPGANSHVVIDDSAGSVAGDPARSAAVRLAHAWRQRDFRLAFSGETDRFQRPEIVLRRDVGERLEALAPFFARSHAVTPVLASDSLYWVVHLYSASERFPLSQHYSVAGVERSYFRHAAVAAVNAHTGRVTLVAAPEPDPIAAAWVRRFPRLFTRPSALPPGLASALPPETDGVVVQAWVLAQFGARAELGLGAATLPSGAGSDTTLGVTARALALLPGVGVAGPAAVPAWTLPMLAATTRPAGVLVALGGASPRTLWLPAAGVEPRWRDVTDQLRSAADRAAIPTTVVGPGASAVVRGRVRVLPVAGRLVYVQPTYVRTGDGRARLATVAVLADTLASAARDLAGALGTSPAASREPGASAPPAALRARIAALYDAMRDALRRGDWQAFGLAFDSLGAAVRDARP